MSLADAIERAYRTQDLEPEHVLRRAVAELRLLREELDRERESSERFRRIAVEARAALAAAPITPNYPARDKATLAFVASEIERWHEVEGNRLLENEFNAGRLNGLRDAAAWVRAQERRGDAR